jgi:hypothetical protein
MAAVTAETKVTAVAKALRWAQTTINNQLKATAEKTVDGGGGGGCGRVNGGW